MRTKNRLLLVHHATIVPFETLNEKKSKGFDMLLKCKNCDHVYTFHRDHQSKDIPFMLTDAEIPIELFSKSKRTKYLRLMIILKIQEWFGNKQN